MLSYKKKLRIRIIFVGLFFLLISSVFLGFAFREGIEFYKVPSQILQSPPKASLKLRMGGLVEKGSVKRLEDSKIIFGVTDTVNSINVYYEGILPDLFSEGQGVVVLGTFNGQSFQAVQVLAKHDETYMPTEVIKSLEREGIYLYKDN
jgi:cytochrome c-type biogenesis protein CcmE